MPFQFMCPQGHLLEGTESMMGQQSQCPLCGSMFIVPVIGPAPAMPPTMPSIYAQPPGYAPPPSPQPGWQPPFAASPNTPQEAYPQYQAMANPAPPATFTPPATGFGPPATGNAAMPAVSETANPPPPTSSMVASSESVGAAAAVAAAAEVKPAEERVVRILCPNGHELHTPMDMIGMEALCPQCNAQFLLRYEDSIEYAEERKAARLKREEAFSKTALKWSIVAAVVVFLALVVMIVISVMD